MIIFLLTFLFVYGGINVYAFVRARSILHFPLPVAIPIIVILVFLVLAPALVRISESRQLEALACTLAYIGYLWMAFIFLFFVSCLTFDAARYIFSLFQAAGRSPAASLLAFFLAVFISLALVIYGFRDAQIIRVKRLEINVNQALPDNGRLRIVQISDVHIGLIIQEKRLQKVLEAVKKENPDLLISTGDLLDGELNNVMPLASQFDQIKPKYGKFAVTGNHEFYAGIESALTFTRQAGFAVLRNEKKKVAGINIIGIDDITGHSFGVKKTDFKLPESLAEIDDQAFILLLQHQPYVDENAKFHLQLSGHTHRGQIFPFSLITRLLFSRNYGYYELTKGRKLYVSSGTGTWGPPVRVFAPPEITVIDLIGRK